MSTKHIVIFWVFLIGIQHSLMASEGDTGLRNITGFGCHLEDGTCYFDIDGSPVGHSSCLGNNIRFNVIDSANGKTWLSIIEAAYIADKQVQLNISGCYSRQPIFPTFTFGRMIK